MRNIHICVGVVVVVIVGGGAAVVLTVAADVVVAVALWCRFLLCYLLHLTAHTGCGLMMYST